MKIKPEDLDSLRVAIAPLDTPERRAQYLASKFYGASRVTNLEMRYRWDLLWAAGVSDWVSRTVYKYANDSQVDTALRSIVPPLQGAK